jgi:ribulose-bisphosphate carboxylase large chain
MNERIHASYLIETADDPRRAVEVMAGEQSSGTFMPLPGETPELKERYGARIEHLDVVEEVAEPSLPGAKAGPVYRRARVELSWPLENLGPSLPNLMSPPSPAISSSSSSSRPRILDITLPPAFAAAYPGPAFGIEGTRRLTGVAKGPLIGTIIKPSVGLSPAATAEMVEALCDGGIDFIKDDELQADGPHCPFEDRARAVMAVIERHADRLGRKVMYAFNVTGDLDQMKRRHDLVRDLGGTCIMASLNSVGLVGMIELRRHASCRSTRTATAGATSRATRCSAGPTPPGRSSGGSPAPTTCTSTG